MSDDDKDSRYRVALELMSLIASKEQGESHKREYWLKLYRECFKAVADASLPDSASLAKTADEMKSMTGEEAARLYQESVG